jgi:hypothetical protein
VVVIVLLARASLPVPTDGWSSVDEMFTCRLLGHDPLFTHDGASMRWECRRGCGDGGAKVYPSAAEAQKYAAAFNVKGGASGDRAPLIALLPLRIWNRLRQRSSDP